MSSLLTYLVLELQHSTTAIKFYKYNDSNAISGAEFVNKTSGAGGRQLQDGGFKF